jgi:hypothetical protein
MHFRTLLTFKDSETFVQKFSRDVIDAVKPRMDDSIPEEKKEYLLYFALVGSLAVIREWILSGFRTPVEDMADLIDRMTKSLILGQN